MATHQLVLKVMRTSRPGFDFQFPTVFDQKNLPGTEALTASSLLDIPSLPAKDRLNELGISQLLILSANFGNIYLGESFSAYLSVNNDSQIPVQDVSFKAELQTTSQRFVLANSSSLQSSPRESLTGSQMSLAPDSHQGILPGQSAEFLITHEIKELGVHILVCSVQYKLSDNELPKFFRKFYKFQVLNPLSVKTKTNTLADGRVALEAQLQNLCSLPIYLERMNFEPNDLFNFVDYNYLEDAQLFQPMISSQSIRQYLYMIEPKSKGIQAKMTPQLGKLDISWQTAFGQTGKLGTAWLVRKIVDTDPFDVIIVAQSPNTRAEQSFTVKCRVRNHSSEVVRIQIRGNKSNMCNVLMNGPNQLLVGNVDPESSVEFDLDLFSLSAGQFRITGLVAVDQISGISKELDQLAMIQVT